MLIGAPTARLLCKGAVLLEAQFALRELRALDVPLELRLVVEGAPAVFGEQRVERADPRIL
eukprot:1748959-Alexandrium_andersonii.AAC.1